MLFVVLWMSDTELLMRVARAFPLSSQHFEPCWVTFSYWLTGHWSHSDSSYEIFRWCIMKPVVNLFDGIGGSFPGLWSQLDLPLRLGERIGLSLLKSHSLEVCMGELS